MSENAILQHFLVPLDGSAMAEAAIPIAAGLARPLGATITLLHILERAAPRTIHGEPHLQTRAEAEHYLTQVGERWLATGVKIDWHVHPNQQGDVARSLVEHAEELHADVIVITTHGWGGLRDLLFGSIAQQVLRRGNTPTLIVRPPPDGVVAHYACRSILVPLDKGHDAEAALPYTRAIATATGARVLLISVVPTVGTASGELAASATFSPTATAAVLDLATEQTAAYLLTQAASIRPTRTNVDTRVARGKPAEQITAIVEDQVPDLVIMSTHARIGLEGTWSGSVASRLLGTIRQPILLIRVHRESDGKEDKA